MHSLENFSPENLREARQNIADVVVKTPLVPLYFEGSPAQIYLKLENLQPIGSFKIRGAANAIAKADPSVLAQGIWTASAGNMAQGVAWCARRLSVSCTVIAPDSAPAIKLSAIERLGAETISVPFDKWLEIFQTRRFEGLDGLFIHAFSDPAVMAGNGTIAMEILDDLPDVDTIITPYGGGGLSCGVAGAIRQLKPEVRCIAAEVESAAPLSASLAAGEPVEVDFEPSFVDGIGAPFLFAEMWALASQLLDEALISTLDEVATAIRLLARYNHIIAEGAGAAAVAAALSERAGTGKIVCVVSGGNIDAQKLATILHGSTP